MVSDETPNTTCAQKHNRMFGCSRMKVWGLLTKPYSMSPLGTPVMKSAAQRAGGKKGHEGSEPRSATFDQVSDVFLLRLNHLFPLQLKHAPKLTS